MADKHAPRTTAAPPTAGKQKRTDMVSVRLAPDLRYAADIAARYQRRTLSSLVEVAVAAYLRKLEVEEPAAGGDNQPMELMKLMETLWDPDESDRFVTLAENHRWLLTKEEGHRWKAIRERFDVRGRFTQEQRKALQPIYTELKEEVAAKLEGERDLRRSTSDGAGRGKRL